MTKSHHSVGAIHNKIYPENAVVRDRRASSLLLETDNYTRQHRLILLFLLLFVLVVAFCRFSFVFFLLLILFVNDCLLNIDK
jgi:hypothetical protein